MKTEETKEEKAVITDYSITKIIAGFLRPLSAFVGIALVYLFSPKTILSYLRLSCSQGPS